jgi:elongation of very long chain fatty acids protein 6
MLPPFSFFLTCSLTRSVFFSCSSLAQAHVAWGLQHPELPLAFSAAYLLFVFLVPSRIKTGFPLKTGFALWNFFLSIFSIIGVSRTVPALIDTLATHGWNYSLCAEPLSWYLKGPSGIWVTIFIYSKMPELLDTVFLILMKKPVIFLHWYHHITVLLYCWHAYHNTIGTGLWFAAMNFTVHSVMYMYFGLQTMGLAKGLTRMMALPITVMQITQMIMGCIVTATSATRYFRGETCKVEPTNLFYGFIMYLSYFILFAKLFYDKYIVKAPKTDKAPKAEKDSAKATKAKAS